MHTPTEKELDTLGAILRVESGSWEFIEVSDIQDCIKKGWVFQANPNHYKLTEKGKNLLFSTLGIAISVSRSENI